MTRTLFTNIGLLVTNDPDVGAGATGTVCTSCACAAPNVSALNTMTVRMLHFIDGSMA